MILVHDGKITDDEIKDLRNQFKSRNVTFIFDSCHSADVAREGTYTVV